VIYRFLALGICVALASCGGGGGGGGSDVNPLPQPASAVESKPVRIDPSLMDTGVQIASVVSPFGTASGGGSIPVQQDTFVIATDGSGEMLLAGFPTASSVELSAAGTATALTRVALGPMVTVR